MKDLELDQKRINAIKANDYDLANKYLTELSDYLYKKN